GRKKGRVRSDACSLLELLVNEGGVAGVAFFVRETDHLDGVGGIVLGVGNHVDPLLGSEVVVGRVVGVPSVLAVERQIRRVALGIDDVVLLGGGTGDLVDVHAVYHGHAHMAGAVGGDDV